MNSPSCSTESSDITVLCNSVMSISVTKNFEIHWLGDGLSATKRYSASTNNEWLSYMVQKLTWGTFPGIHVGVSGVNDSEFSSCPTIAVTTFYLHSLCGVRICYWLLFSSDAIYLLGCMNLQVIESASNGFWQ